MKNDLNNIEQELKNAAQGITFDLDTSEIWANVEPELPPVDNKRRPIWWMTAGIIIGLLISVSIVISISPTSPTNALEGKKLITTEHSTHNISHNPTSESAHPISIASTLEPIKKSKNKRSSSNSTHQITSQNISNSQDLEATTSTSLNNAKTDYITHSQSKIYNDEHHYPEENYGTEIGKTIPGSNSLILKPVIQKPILSYSERKEISLVSLLATKREILSIYSNIDIDYNLPLIEPVNVSSWSPMIMFWTGIGQPNNSITSFGNEAIDLSQFAKETPLIGLTNGLSFGKENTHGWRWSIGLEYSRLTSRYTNNDQQIEMDILNTDESFNIDKNGNTTGNSGTLNVTTVTDYDIKWHRNHEYLTIKMGIGKEIARMNKWSISTDIYGGYNVWSRHNGYYFQEDAQGITKFNNGENNPYVNQGMSIGSRISLTYQIKNFSIGLSPFANMNLQSTTKSTNYYKMKNSHYGIQLGVVYRP